MELEIWIAPTGTILIYSSTFLMCTFLYFNAYLYLFIQYKAALLYSIYTLYISSTYKSSNIQ